MRIDILTCAPGLLAPLFSYGIVKKAIEKGVAEVVVHNLHDYGVGRHRQIDGHAYGGEAGMVLMLAPIVACIEQLQKARTYDTMLYMAPEGQLLKQKIANQLSLQKHLLILCGHYKGVDERIVDHFPMRKISIGSFILPGGELPATILAHSIIRLLPKAISDSTAALNDSFQEEDTIAPPVYTRPAHFRGIAVPEVLRSGDHQKITAWQEAQVKQRTAQYKATNQP